MLAVRPARPIAWRGADRRPGRITIPRRWPTEVGEARPPARHWTGSPWMRWDAAAAVEPAVAVVHPANRCRYTRCTRFRCCRRIRFWRFRRCCQWCFRWRQSSCYRSAGSVRCGAPQNGLVDPGMQHDRADPPPSARRRSTRRPAVNNPSWTTIPAYDNASSTIGAGSCLGGVAMVCGGRDGLAELLYILDSYPNRAWAYPYGLQLALGDSTPDRPG